MIRIVFTASPSFLSKLIRFISHGRVSHVFIQHTSETWGGDWVTEATWPMVMQRPAERARHNIYCEFACLFDAHAGLHLIRNEVGKWYSFEGLFLISWWLLFWRIFKTKIKHPFHSTKGDICSELLVKLFKANTLSGADKLDPDYTTPEMVLQYCECHSELFRLL